MANTAVTALALLLIAGCGSGGDAAKAPEPVTTERAAAPADPGATAQRPERPSAARVPILMYHVIGTPVPGTPLPDLWVEPEEFERQVRTLADAGYVAVTLSDVLDGWAGRKALPRKPVVLSFDDGYLGQGQIAGPILKRQKWPGVLYLKLGNLGAEGGLSEGRVRTMIADGWELGSHTITHPDLSQTSGEALRREVAGSREQLRRRFGVQVATFCYPAGRYDDEVIAAVRAAGYRAATTVEPGLAAPGDPRMRLPRVRVSRGQSAADVLALISG